MPGGGLGGPEWVTVKFTGSIPYLGLCPVTGGFVKNGFNHYLLQYATGLGCL